MLENSLASAVCLARDGDDSGAMEAIAAALAACDRDDAMRAQMQRLLLLARAAAAETNADDAPDFVLPSSGTMAALMAWAEGLWADDARIEALRAAVATGDAGNISILAIALTAWSRRAAARGRVFAAAPVCREAAALLRGLAPTQDPSGQFRLADCLKLLGAIEASVGNAAEGAKAAAEACRILRALSEREPALLPVFASALHNMAGVRLRCGDHGGAVSAARQAAELRRELAGSEMSRAELAESLSQSSLALQAAGFPGEARAACTEAASIYRQLAAKDERFNADLAAALRLGSQQALAEQRWHDGLTLLDEEIALYRLQPDAPGCARPLAEALHNRGVFLGWLGDDAQALAAAREAIAVRRDLPRRAPAKERADLAASLSFFGALARRLELVDEAAAAFQEAVDLLHNLRDGLDLGIEEGLAKASVELAAVRAQLGEIAAAAAATDIAAGAYAAVAGTRAEAGNISAHANALLQSGDLHRRAGASGEAIKAYAAAAALRGALSKVGGNQLVAIGAGHKLVICLKRAGRSEEAREWAERLGMAPRE
ncbi:MAG: hypothetical protein ABL883_03760 [Terricaulis sp.]